MAGKQGAKSLKATDTGARYEARFLEEMDGRLAVAKALQHRLRLLTADLGGLSGLSYIEQSISKRFVHMESEIEKKELIMASGREVDENKYVNLVATLSGLGSKLGLKRRVKVLALADYLSSKASEPTPATPTENPVKAKEPDAS